MMVREWGVRDKKKGEREREEGGERREFVSPIMSHYY